MIIRKEEIMEALNLADKALIDMPNFPGIVTPEMIVNLAGSILIANELREIKFDSLDYFADDDPIHDIPNGKPKYKMTDVEKSYRNTTCFPQCRVKHLGKLKPE